MFTFINIFGLALSMSVCLLVLMRLKDLWGYDRFHPGNDRIYRVITRLTNKQGQDFRFATAPLPLEPSLKQDYNIADAVTRLYVAGNMKAVAAKKELTISEAFTDNDFFNVFGFTLYSGNSQAALQQPNSIVISKDLAMRFFGSPDVVGQTIAFEKLGNFQVTGVMNEPAGKSHISFDAYLSISSVPALEKTGSLAPVIEQWGNFTSGYTYIKLKPQVSKRQLTDAITAKAAALMKISNLQGREHIAFEAQALNNIVLGEELQYSLGNAGGRGKALAEIAIAFVILLAACFNYTNLSIARSMNRGKEVGVRKVAGAARIQVFGLFITEALLVSLLSLVLAYVLLQLMVGYPAFAEFVPRNFSFDITLYLWFAAFSVFTGLLAGALPAWALSSFKPVQVLKNLSTIKLFGGNRFRQALTVLQLALSLVIVIFTLTFSRQFSYMATANPGFDRSNQLYIPLRGKGDEATRLATDLNAVPGVQLVAAASAKPGYNQASAAFIRRDAGKEAIRTDCFDADRNFIAAMRLTLLAGTTFPSAATDSTEQYIIVNEKAMHILGINTPAEAVGALAIVDDTVQVRIAGVLKDFYLRGMDMPVFPLVLRNRPLQYNFLTVRTTTADKQVYSAVESAWKKDNPSLPFEGKWLQEELYEKGAAWSTVSMLGFLALISVTIACLGLLGMVIYTTQTRQKEIGVRKVMGAEVSTIIALLSKGFLKLVLIAGCIALPVAYILMYLFLNIFANRISPAYDLLLLSFAGMICLVLLTVGTQIYKAATANPVNALRNE